MGRRSRLGPRRRSRAPDTEPERSLTRLRARGTQLHLQPSEGPPRHPRQEPDLRIGWWWHHGGRTVILGTQVVSILRPTEVEGGPLRFLAAQQIVIVGTGGPEPGGVQRARGAGLILDPAVPAARTHAVPPTRTPKALERLIGETVELHVTGGDTVEHGGAVCHEGTDRMPAPRGRLVAAQANDRHLMLILDDLTVAVLHEPCRVHQGDDGTVWLDGDVGRVVLDLPDADVHVARDATLQIRATGGGPGRAPTGRSRFT